MAAHRPHVEFRSDNFAARPGEEQQINSGRWGAALVDYLEPQLAAHITGPLTWTNLDEGRRRPGSCAKFWEETP